jgi:hypothetical protein
MNHKDSVKLMEINAKVYNEHRKKMEKKEIQTGHKAVKSHSGRFTGFEEYQVREKKVVDPKEAKELDKHVDAEVRKMVKSGKIAPPKRDKFIDMMRKKMA